MDDRKRIINNRTLLLNPMSFKSGWSTFESVSAVTIPSFYVPVVTFSNISFYFVRSQSYIIGGSLFIHSLLTIRRKDVDVVSSLTSYTVSYQKQPVITLSGWIPASDQLFHSTPSLSPTGWFSLNSPSCNFFLRYSNHMFFVLELLYAEK